MQPHQFVHERESDAGALVGSRPRALDAVEAIEEPRQVVAPAMPTPVSCTESDTLSPSIAQRRTSTPP